MDITPEQWQTTPEVNILYKHKKSVIFVICCQFFSLNAFLTGDFTIFGRGSHRGNVTKFIYIYFRPPSHGGPTRTFALLGQVVLKEDHRKWWTTYGRAPEFAYTTISSSCEPNGSGEPNQIPVLCICE